MKRAESVGTVMTYRGIHERVREMSSQLFVSLYTLSIYPSAHKQLRRHLPNPFREFPCITIQILCLDGFIQFNHNNIFNTETGLSKKFNFNQCHGEKITFPKVYRFFVHCT